MGLMRSVVFTRLISLWIFFHSSVTIRETVTVVIVGTFGAGTVLNVVRLVAWWTKVRVACRWSRRAFQRR